MLLEPRLGHDVNPTEEFNNDEAVFASRNLYKFMNICDSDVKLSRALTM